MAEMNSTYIIIDITKDKHKWNAWITKKHYAKRVPIILKCFGLYKKDDNELLGVCSFGPPPRMLNSGYGCFNSLELQGFELNRLCIIDDHEKNLLSFFVSSCLSEMKKLFGQCFIVSYADIDMNHHGYIYQSTNWLYTGKIKGDKKYKLKSGKVIHGRSLVQKTGSRAKDTLNDEIEIIIEKGKYRYFYFLGSARQCKYMKKDFKYKVLDYPKGANKRYDSSYKPKNNTLF